MTASPISGNQFVRVPHTLLKTPNTSAATIATYVALASYANRQGQAWPSVPSLAKRAGLSEKVARREVQRLVRLGFLTSTPHHDPASGARRSNRYTLLWQSTQAKTTPTPDAKSTQAPGDNDHQPGDGNDRGTTTTKNKNQITNTATAVVAANWSPTNKSQGEKSVVKAVQQSLDNGVPEAELARVLRELDRSGSYISELSITLARSQRKPLKGALAADQPQDWASVREKLRREGF